MLAAPGIAAFVDENIVGQDSLTGQVVLQNAIAEAVAAADLVSSLGVFQVEIIDSLQASEETSVFGTLTRSVAESATASDRVTRRFLWEFIDDSQNVSWQIINTIE